jgi:hypothetical protein
MFSIYKLIIVSLTLFLTSHSFATEVICVAKGKYLRQGPYERHNVDARLTFHKTVDKNGLSILKNVVGYILTGYDEDLFRNRETYFGVFHFNSIEENSEYRPWKYTNSFQYPYFNAKKTTGYDGGGMKGYFILEKNLSSKNAKGHYIFHSGNHMAGTIDFNCRLDH